MDEILILAIIFGSLLAMMKMWLNYRSNGQRSSAPAGAPSMTSSELKAMISEAVEEAMDRRMSRLEEHLDRPYRIMPASDQEEARSVVSLEERGRQGS